LSRRFEHKKRGWLKFIHKVAGFLLAGMLVNIGMPENPGTYALFTHSAFSKLEVRAASTEDILQLWEVVEDCTGSSRELVLQKAEKCGSSPVIYFSLEGEAANYVLHINPVTLSSGEKYEIPIDTDVNLMQYMELLSDRRSFIEGTVRIKYLNAFVDEAKTIKISRSLLLERFMQPIRRGGVQAAGPAKYGMTAATPEGPDSGGDAEKDVAPSGALASLIRRIASFGVWDRVTWSGEAGRLSPPEMRPEQDRVVNTVAPGLEEYIGALREANEGLREQLDRKSGEAGDLEKALKELEERYSAAQDELRALKAGLDAGESGTGPPGGAGGAAEEQDHTRAPGAGEAGEGPDETSGQSMPAGSPVGAGSAANPDNPENGRQTGMDSSGSGSGQTVRRDDSGSGSTDASRTAEGSGGSSGAGEVPREGRPQAEAPAVGTAGPENGTTSGI
jgi:hypothetical protein